MDVRCLALILLTGCPIPIVIATPPPDAGTPCRAATCAELGLDCGSADDGCGGTVSCGTCPPDCRPKSCAMLDKTCGQWSDGCGHLLECGTCTAGRVCGADGIPGVCAQPRCGSNGWCWENPQPAGWDLTGVRAFARDDAWAIGRSNLWYSGGILHWDGAHWRNGLDATVPALSAIWASSPSDIWCSGTDGSALHYDGDRWTSTMIASDVPWSSVSGTGPSDVWLAGGDHGRVAHFDGVAWTVSALSSTVRLYAISSFSPTDVWAAGRKVDVVSTDAGFYPELVPVVLRYDGSAWSELPLPHTERETELDSITALGASDIYLVGLIDTLHWNGVDFEWLTDGRALWTSTDQVTFRIRSASGRVELSVLDGGAWSVAGVTPADDRIDSWQGGRAPWHLGGTTSDDVWIVGQLGRAYHWDGRTFVETESTLTHGSLGAMRGFEDQLWVAGVSEVLHFDGRRWSRSTFNGSAYGLYVPARDKAWAVSGSQIVERQGNQWLVRDQLDFNVVLYGIDGSGPNDIWAVGNNGTVRHFDGQTWRSVATGTTLALTAVAAIAPGDVWVGGRGELLHRVGEGWVVYPLPTLDAPTLFATGPHDVWAASYSGVFHWDGESWGRIAGLSGRTTFAGTGPDDVWLGGMVDVAHFDGERWETIPYDSQMTGLWVTTSAAWAAGPHGTMMRRAR